MNFFKADLSRIGIVLAISMLSIVGCQFRREASTDQTPLNIIVSIPPQAYFVDRIGGEAVNVETLVPAGAEPHTYEPKPEQLKAISQADAYLQIRIDFEEAWMDRFSAANPQLLVVDTTSDIERLPLPPGIHETESELAAGETNHSDEADNHGHEHGHNADPHVWLSPQLVKTQAQTIYTVLAQLDPEQATQFQSNLEIFLNDIERLDTNIQDALQDVSQRQFLVFHPAWGYFARDYNLQMVAIEVGGQEPSAAELAELIGFAQQQQIKVVFAAPQFSQRASETIAKEIGGKVLLIDPLAYDWLENLQMVAKSFSEVL